MFSKDHFDFFIRFIFSYVSIILKKEKDRSLKIKFSKIGLKDDLIIVGIGDVSFKVDDKAVGRVLSFLAYSSIQLRLNPAILDPRVSKHRL